MDHLLEAYASSSDDAESDRRPTAIGSTLGELPVDVLGMFQDSEYNLETERRRAEERAGDKVWVRRFPHERGNWPTYVFVPVPNSVPFVRMAEASVAHFRRRLSLAWEERRGSDGARRGTKRARTGGPSPTRGGKRLRGHEGPPEVVMNDMGPSGQQHLSLSKTVVLRAHEIEPFVEGLKDAVKSSRSLTASIVGGYDVLVNDEKTRSFVCLRVRAGRQVLLQLIGRVDPLMRRFNQPEYYKDPVVHVSVASVLGDVSSYFQSPWSNGSVIGVGRGRVGGTQAARSSVMLAGVWSVMKKVRRRGRSSFLLASWCARLGQDFLKRRCCRIDDDFVLPMVPLARSKID